MSTLRRRPSICTSTWGSGVLGVNPSPSPDVLMGPPCWAASIEWPSRLLDATDFHHPAFDGNRSASGIEARAVADAQQMHLILFDKGIDLPAVRINQHAERVTLMGWL